MDANTDKDVKHEFGEAVATEVDAVAAAFRRAEEICTNHARHHERGGSPEAVVNACLYLAGRMRYERDHGRGK
jgi:hypothetical protein